MKALVYVTGNCQAVLVRDNRPYLLTKSHTYANKKERNRIISSGKHNKDNYLVVVDLLYPLKTLNFQEEITST